MYFRFSFLITPPPPTSTLFPYTTLFRSDFRRAPVTRINERIRVPQVRVITDDGEQFGVMDTRDAVRLARDRGMDLRSEEHTSELQSRFDLVCRLLLEKKKKQQLSPTFTQ